MFGRGGARAAAGPAAVSRRRRSIDVATGSTAQHTRAPVTCRPIIAIFGSISVSGTEQLSRKTRVEAPRAFSSRAAPPPRSHFFPRAVDRPPRHSCTSHPPPRDLPRHAPPPCAPHPNQLRWCRPVADGRRWPARGRRAPSPCRAPASTPLAPMSQRPSATGGAVHAGRPARARPRRRPSSAASRTSMARAQAGARGTGERADRGAEERRCAPGGS